QLGASAHGAGVGRHAGDHGGGDGVEAEAVLHHRLGGAGDGHLDVDDPGRLAGGGHDLDLGGALEDGVLGVLAAHVDGGVAGEVLPLDDQGGAAGGGPEGGGDAGDLRGRLGLVGEGAFEHAGHAVGVHHLDRYLAVAGEGGRHHRELLAGEEADGGGGH